MTLLVARVGDKKDIIFNVKENYYRDQNSTAKQMSLSILHLDAANIIYRHFLMNDQTQYTWCNIYIFH